MRTLLKKLRSIYIINLILRNCVLWIKPLHTALFRKLADHMPVQGTVRISLQNKKVIRMYSNSDDFMLKEVFFGITDENGTDRLVGVLAPVSNVVLDVGANTGLFSLFCFGYNSKAQIHSFEPVKTIGDRFLKNCELNDAKSITLHRTILSDHSEGERVLYVPNTDISYSSSTLKEFHDASAVTELILSATTIDIFKKQHSIPKIDLMKIDVEWHEYEVLNGAIHTLELDAPILIIEVLFAETEEAKNPLLKGKLPKDHHHKIANLLQHHGYYFYEIDALGLTRVEVLLPGKHERNYLFSKKQSKDRRLLFSQPETIVAQLVS